MKKQSLILILLIISSFLLSGLTIKVTNPVSATVVLKGDNVNITWQKLAKMNGFVKIRLFNSNGTQKILELTNKTANKGSFKWTYIGNVKDGDYKIRVRTVDNKDSGDSQTFTIGKKSSPPPPPPPPSPPEEPEGSFINVTYPNSAIELPRNMPIFIIWDSANLRGDITIELWERDKKYGTIASGIPNTTKKLKWNVGSVKGKPNAPVNKLYRLRISSKFPYDFSDDFFKITDKPALIDDSVNNMITNTYQIKNNTEAMLAIPPVIEEVKVESFEKKYKGQVQHGNKFKVNVKIKNKSKQILKGNWEITIRFNEYIIRRIKSDCSITPRKPGESWSLSTDLIDSGGYNFIENKNGFHIIKATLGDSSKSTLIGIIKSEEVIRPQIGSFMIWDIKSKIWAERGEYKSDQSVKLKYSTSGAVKATVTNMSTNEIVSSFNINPPINVKGEITISPPKIGGDLKLTVWGPTNLLAEAKVWAYSNEFGSKYGKGNIVDLWRRGDKAVIKIVSGGYKTLKFIQVLKNGIENFINTVDTSKWEGKWYTWEHKPIGGFPAKYKFLIVYHDYSKQTIIRTLK